MRKSIRDKVKIGDTVRLYPTNLKYFHGVEDHKVVKIENDSYTCGADYYPIFVLEVDEDDHSQQDIIIRSATHKFFEKIVKTEEKELDDYAEDIDQQAFAQGRESSRGGK